jgi:hypothetical protein
MPTALELALLDTVTATVQFGVDTGEMPVTVVSATGRGDDQRPPSHHMPVERFVACRKGR